ncbi:MAG: hypothetical protein H0W96_01135 [Solirubrobacterales bacterium]|nr:hypothetical protein [Solirubrobacterales bacterium]
MQIKTRIIATAGILAALTLAAPAAAHEGHASCGEAARSFVVPMAQAGEAGTVASAQAQAGTINEGTAAAHAALCENK